MHAPGDPAGASDSHAVTSPHLWIAVGTGPIAWSLDLLVGNAVAANAYRAGLASVVWFGAPAVKVLVLLVSALAIGATMAASWYAWRLRIRYRETPASAPGAPGRAEFMVTAALLVGTLALIGLIMKVAAVFFLPSLG